MVRGHVAPARHAGLDQPVVVDNGIVTSRNPGDLDAFCSKILEEIDEGRHRRTQAAE